MGTPETRHSPLMPALIAHTTIAKPSLDVGSMLLKSTVSTWSYQPNSFAIKAIAIPHTIAILYAEHYR